MPHEVSSQAGPPLGVRGHGAIHVPDRADDRRVQLFLRKVQFSQVSCKKTKARERGSGQCDHVVGVGVDRMLTEC